MISGADPGFPIGGGANHPGGERRYTNARFVEKLHKIKKISIRRGGARRERPLGSATGYISKYFAEPYHSS